MYFSTFPVEHVDCLGNELLPETLLVIHGEMTWADFLEATEVTEAEALELFPWQLHPEYEEPDLDL